VKRAAIGDNLARALRDATPPADVVLVGGVAGDVELPGLLDDALPGAAVGRGDIAAGAGPGHRWAVAYGLTLLAAADVAAVSAGERRQQPCSRPPRRRGSAGGRPPWPRPPARGVDEVAERGGSTSTSASGCADSPRRTATSPPVTRTSNASSPRRTWYTVSGDGPGRRAVPAADGEHQRVRAGRGGRRGAQRRAVAPPAEVEQHRLEAAAPVGELVGPGADRRAEPAAAQDADRSSSPQALREDVGAGVAQATPEVGETLGP
jgi:hypothetical protein